MSVNEGVCAPLCAYVYSAPQDTSFQMEPPHTAPPQGNINIKGKLSNSVNKGAAYPKFGMDRRHHPALFLFSTRTSARNSHLLAQIPSQQPCFKGHCPGDRNFSTCRSGTSPMSCTGLVTKQEGRL